MSLTPNLLCHADCLALLERVESGIAQLVYLDRPRSLVRILESMSEIKEAPSDYKDYLEWLSKVIQQAKRVCLNEGSVVICTEPKVHSYIRVIADRIFGRDSVTEIVLRAGVSQVGLKKPDDSRKSLLLCQLSSNSIYYPPTRELTKEEIKARFNHKDAAGRFALVDIMSSPFTASSGRASLSYEWKGVIPSKGRHWKFTEEKMRALDAEGRIYYSPTNRRPYLKRYASESAGVAVGNVWDDLPAHELAERLHMFELPQSIALLERVISTTTDDDGIVIDPFCGSGVSLIAAHLAARRWIGGDINAQTIGLTQKRLKREAGAEMSVHYQVIEEDALKEHTPIPILYAPSASGLVESPSIRFVRGEPIALKEDEQNEFKEVKGNNPVGSIKSVVDEYTVAFLNSGGGRILWGIKDENRVVTGVVLTQAQYDEIGRVVESKLCQIQPEPGPSTWRLEFHPVYENEAPIPDLYVVEVTVLPPLNSRILYATGSRDFFLKTGPIRKRLTVLEVQEEVIRRNRQ